MKNLHIQNSYNIWSLQTMTNRILEESYNDYGSILPEEILNRSWSGMYLEWYLHNIGYWLTLPFIKNETVKQLNERFKHLDLEERVHSK